VREPRDSGIEVNRFSSTELETAQRLEREFAQRSNTTTYMRCSAMADPKPSGRLVNLFRDTYKCFKRSSSPNASGRPVMLLFSKFLDKMSDNIYTLESKKEKKGFYSCSRKRRFPMELGMEPARLLLSSKMAEIWSWEHSRPYHEQGSEERFVQPEDSRHLVPLRLVNKSNKASVSWGGMDSTARQKRRRTRKREKARI
jgi:hypothetical protein